MQEILTVIAYLAAWLICKEVLRIQSGLVTLIISLGAAVTVFILSAVKKRDGKSDVTGSDEHNGD